MSFNSSLKGYLEEFAATYESKSQLARAISEHWVGDNMFCPFCASDKIEAYNNNHPVADFFCDWCGEEFQLKAKREYIGNTIVDGEYNKMIGAINSNALPNFLLMSYAALFEAVNDFLIVPKEFVLPGFIKKRKPLSQSARRAGWTGCNIVLKDIPENGRVYVIKDRHPVSPTEVRTQVGQTESFRQIKDVEQRGWIADVLNVVNRIQNNTFCLGDVYAFIPELQVLHPENHNVDAKIRQQLQRLRKYGIIDFLGRGLYRKRR